jgi:hypothetical protein
MSAIKSDRGDKCAAPQRIILKERPPLPRMKDPSGAKPIFAALCLCSQLCTVGSTHPPLHFLVLVENKEVSPNRRLGFPWIALG